jgi:hypothetical protein
VIKLSSGPALSAWNGVLERHLLLVYGRPWLGPAPRVLHPGPTAYTALLYRPLTHWEPGQIANSQRSGGGFRYRPLNPCGSP